MSVDRRSKRSGCGLRTGENHLVSGRLLLAAALASTVLAGGVLPVGAEENARTDKDAAAEQTAARGALEEIVVTARKREESLETTPISISAFSGEDLEVRAVSSIDDMQNFAPNLTFQNNPSFGGSSSSAAVFIRGVGQDDFLPTVDPGVGIYVDGVYVARSVGAVLRTLDFERIEVLRGPQGTLFGRNTIGGAISITTRKPENDLWAEGMLTTGTDGRLDAKGTINFPVSDQLYVMVTGATFNQHGYVRRVAADNKRLGNDNTQAGRVAVRWEPGASFTADLSFDYTRQREHGPALSLAGINLNSSDPARPGLASRIFNPVDAAGRFDPSKLNVPFDAPADNFALLHNYLAFFLGGQDCLVLIPGQPVDGGGNPNNPACYNSQFIKDRHTDFGTAPSFSNLDLWGLSLILDWDAASWMTVKSITAYRDLSSEFARDGDHSPHRIAHFFDSFDQHQFSQELQFLGTIWNGRLDWILGLYFFTEDGNNVNLLEFVPADFKSGGFFDNRSLALFTQETLRITDRLSLTAGFRLTDERKAFLPDQIIFADRTFGRRPDGTLGPLFGVGTRILPNRKARFTITQTTPMANLAYQWTDDVMTYVTYSEGFKSGGFNQRVFPPLPDIPSFGPEFVKVIEGGVKATGFDRRLRLHAAAFHTRYNDLQIQVFRDVAPVTQNAARARINGFEVEMQASPLVGWYLEASAGYLDAQYTKIDPRATQVRLDNRFSKVPKWTAHGAVTREIDLGDAGWLDARLDWSYRSFIFNDALNTPQIAQPGYHLFNAAVGWRSADERWSLRFGVKNLTDKIYLRTGVFFAGGGNAFEHLYDRGRQWYLTLKLRR